MGIIESLDMDHAVGLILDPEFGDRLLDLSRRMPIWIVGSSLNREATIRARSVDSATLITTIELKAGESNVDLLSRAAYSIDDHHGHLSQPTSPYRELVVFGATEEALSVTVRSDLGFRAVSGTPFGFIARK